MFSTLDYTSKAHGPEREENRLVNKLVHHADVDAPPTAESATSEFVQQLADASLAAQNARREKRARRRNLQLVGSEAYNDEAGPAAPAVNAPGVPITQPLIDQEIRRSSREARRTEGRRPRAPRAEAERIASDEMEVIDDGKNELDAELNAEPARAHDSSTADAAGVESDARGRIAERARRKQEYLAASNGSEKSAPVALNRHLILVTEQLTAAHRVIGRVTAERDGLRQQIADIRGVAFEDVVIPSHETSSENEKHHAATTSPHAPSRMAKLNYFGVDDYALMRKRRQGLVLVLMGLILVLWMSARMGYWTMPDNLSRDSLGQLPFVGDLMTYFLAGWLFFRVIRVSSKGVRWVFPTDTRNRRRR